MRQTEGRKERGSNDIGDHLMQWKPSPAIRVGDISELDEVSIVQVGGRNLTGDKWERKLKC